MAAKLYSASRIRQETPRVGTLPTVLSGQALAELVIDEGSYAAQALCDAGTMRAAPPLGAIRRRRHWSNGTGVIQMVEPSHLLRLAGEMAARADQDEGLAALAVLASHATLESMVNQLGRQEIASFNERARFLPKWHDLCERALGRQLESAPDLERLHALRDVIAGVTAPPERLDRRSMTPPPEAPSELVAETARWAVDVARRVVLEFHEAAGRETPDWI